MAFYFRGSLVKFHPTDTDISLSKWFWRWEICFGLSSEIIMTTDRKKCFFYLLGIFLNFNSNTFPCCKGRGAAARVSTRLTFFDELVTREESIFSCFGGEKRLQGDRHFQIYQKGIQNTEFLPKFKM